MIDGDLDASGIDEGSPWKASGDLEEDSSFGGFIGAQCPVMEKYNLTTEFAFSGGGWAIGAGICYAF
jgi:hypothetical protein